MQTEVIHNMETPFLMILGGRDAFVDNNSSRLIHEKAPATVKEIIEFDQACHTLLGDKDFSDDVINSTLSFLDRQIAKN